MKLNFQIKKNFIIGRRQAGKSWMCYGTSEFCMSASFTNQVIAQIELWNNYEKYQKKVYVLPKHLDEKVATLHLSKVGAKLTKLSKEQAEYISVDVKGPFKTDIYRY